MLFFPKGKSCTEADYPIWCQWRRKFFPQVLDKELNQPTNINLTNSDNTAKLIFAKLVIALDLIGCWAACSTVLSLLLLLNLRFTFCLFQAYLDNLLGTTFVMVWKLFCATKLADLNNKSSISLRMREVKLSGSMLQSSQDWTFQKTRNISISMFRTN